ncbi:hypothetical protein ACTU6U_10920 [Microbacterium sp. A196]|uniref:hypothetical protein n=1 Tax=unclassified Microbacterium TaxID=2609290 RepID=UPI003FD61B00
MKTTSRFVAAFALTGTLVLTGCAASLDSVAEECGGSAAGVNADDSGIMIDVGAGADGLLCVVPKVFSDKSDQYAVALLLDDGLGQTSEIDGREVKTGSLGGSPFVFIAN